MKKHRLISFLAALVLTVTCCASAMALSSSTLSLGSRGNEVQKLQQALIDLGYLKGKADGIFGNQTYQAVLSFQHAKKLEEDGLAGRKTQALLYEAAEKKKGTSEKTEKSEASAASTSGTSNSASSSSSSSSTASSSSSASSGNLFHGNYTTLRINEKSDRVTVLQDALIRLNYLTGKADGIFGNKTEEAVKLFQTENNLKPDGLAGKKTLAAIEKADKNGKKHESSSSSSSGTETSGAVPVAIKEESAPAVTTETSSDSSPSSAITLTAPDGGTLKLLHWFNDIKKTIGGGSRLLVVDPATGISWTLRVHSCGRHCDAEPATAEDTANMLEAFGGVNTWDTKGVYVKLPSGVWTVASTHDNPHMTGKVTDNNFNGHLCVHFLRDMSETQANDPKYGVTNQKTIRALWKSITGEEITK